MLERLLALCLLLATCSGCLGQPAVRQRKGMPGQQRTDTRLNGLTEQLKAVDEPTMRVFLLIQYATFLWGSDREGAAVQAENLAADAMADLQAHGNDIPSLYSSLFRRDLLTLLNLHAPALAARLTERYQLERTPGEQLETAFALLDSKGGASAAVEKARAALLGGQDPSHMISFFLHRLAEENPAALAGLLPDILKPEEQQPGSFSLDTLNSLKYFYLKDGTPTALQARFCLIVINATRTALTEPDQGQALKAANILRQALPSISTSAPSLYAQASAQLAALAARTPAPSANQTDVADRIRQSADQLSQLLTEAEAAKDPALRERLLTSAAQLALSKGQLKLAIDLVMQPETTDKSHVMWRDQFLGDVTSRALGQKDTALAESAVTKIDGAFNRAAATQRLALYFYAAKDVYRARELLNETLKLLAAAENQPAKAAAYLRLITAFTKVDEQRVPEVTQLALKSLNNIPESRLAEQAGGEARKEYAKTLMLVAHQVIFAFRSLAQRDEIGALGIADSITRREIKAAAIFGVYTAEPTARVRTKAVAGTN